MFKFKTSVSGVFAVILGVGLMADLPLARGDNNAQACQFVKSCFVVTDAIFTPKRFDQIAPFGELTFVVTNNCPGTQISYTARSPGGPGYSDGVLYYMGAHHIALRTDSSAYTVNIDQCVGSNGPGTSGAAR